MKEPRPNSEIHFKGSSMFPLLLENDLLEVQYFEKPQSVQSRKRGEILLIRESGEWVFHRVIKKTDALLTKGDWSLSSDQSDQAWGRLARINGLPCEALHSDFFSKISERIGPEQPRFLRWFFRTALLLFGGLTRWRELKGTRGQY